MMEKFEALVARRKALGISLRAVSDQMGWHIANVCAVEKGRRNASPSFVGQYYSAMLKLEARLQRELDKCVPAC